MQSSVSEYVARVTSPLSFSSTREKMGDFVDDLSAEDLALLVMELPTLHMPTMTVPKATDFVHSGIFNKCHRITQVEHTGRLFEFFKTKFIK